MKTMGALVLGTQLIASCSSPGTLPAVSRQPEDRIVRLAELEIFPDQVAAYQAALKEEISASMEKEQGVLTLYAVSPKNRPESIRLFEMYRNAASYQAHLQSAHFLKYKEQTRSMVKSLALIEADPIQLATKVAPGDSAHP